jgi:hypothetical protein
MGPDRTGMEPARQRKPEAEAMPSPRGKEWRRWLIALGMLCLLGAAGRPAGADPVCPDSQATVSASFDFNEFTRDQPFRLNTCMTTSYGPAWADILVKPENFLQCKGASIALCYYSGP